MGGHTQFGEFLTTDSAILAMQEEILLYVDKFHMTLKYAQITFDSESGMYKLAMRFTK